MKKGKKLLAFVLALVICLSLGAVNVFAAELIVNEIQPDFSNKIDTNSAISIRFEKNIGSNATNNKDKFILVGADGTTVPYEVLFNTSDSYKQYVFIKPKQNLEPQKDYKLTILAGVSSNSGDSISTDKVYTFTTKQKSEATNDIYNAAEAAGVQFTKFSFNDSGSGLGEGVTDGNTEDLNFSGAYVLNNRKDTYKDISTINAGIPTDATIALVFDGNMATNAEEIAEHIILKDKNGQSVSKHMYFYDKNSGTMTPDPTGENKPQRVIFMDPDNALNPNEDYTIVLEAGITSGQSGRPLANPGTISFKTNAQTGYVDPNFEALRYVKVLPEMTPSADTAPNTSSTTVTGGTTVPITTNQKETVADTNDGNEIAVVVSSLAISVAAVYVVNKGRKD